MVGTSKAMKIANRRKQVAELYLKGVGQIALAEKFEVDQSTISRDLSTLYEVWRMSAIRDFDLAKQIELERINTLEQEYWTAWEKSKSDKQTVLKKSSKRGNSNQANHSEASVKTEKREGDARFLQGVQWCISERCRILGLHDNKQTLEVVTAKDRVIKLIQDGKLNYAQLTEQVGEETAKTFFKLAGK